MEEEMKQQQRKESGEEEEEAEKQIATTADGGAEKGTARTEPTPNDNCELRGITTMTKGERRLTQLAAKPKWNWMHLLIHVFIVAVLCDLIVQMCAHSI